MDRRLATDAGEMSRAAGIRFTIRSPLRGETLTSRIRALRGRWPMTSSGMDRRWVGALSGSATLPCRPRSSPLWGSRLPRPRHGLGFCSRPCVSGAPPHGGIAYGVDRIVQRLFGAESIRDVIAFPKTASGADPLTGAPAPVGESQLREVGLQLRTGSTKGQRGR